MSSFANIPVVDVFDIDSDDDIVGNTIQTRSKSVISPNRPKVINLPTPPSDSNQAGKELPSSSSTLNLPILRSYTRKPNEKNAEGFQVSQSNAIQGPSKNSSQQPHQLPGDSNQSAVTDVVDLPRPTNWTPNLPSQSNTKNSTRKRKSQIILKNNSAVDQISQPQLEIPPNFNGQTARYTRIPGPNDIRNRQTARCSRAPGAHNNQAVRFIPPVTQQFPVGSANQFLAHQPYNGIMFPPMASQQPLYAHNSVKQIVDRALQDLNPVQLSAMLQELIKNPNIPSDQLQRHLTQPNINNSNPQLIPQTQPIRVPETSRYIQKPTEDQLIQEDEGVEEDPDGEFREVDMYADYLPSKLKIGKPHPDPVVETSSLSTVQPPDINYTLSLPKELINKGLLSSLQLEAVIYACQQHAKNPTGKNPRPGFLIGDGAGVGKGRTIAGIIYENFLQGRKKSIWVSVSSDLKFDAERDLNDIGAKNIPVHLLGKFAYGRRLDPTSGVMFTTYSGLVSKSQSVRNSFGTRLGQLLNWVGPKFDGCIVFDECHKAKNINPTKLKNQSKTATAVLEIQEKLPNARVVYASATGACETRNLGYMSRLGMWGPESPYENFNLFKNSIDRRGVGAMELVAVDLKMRGSYIARQLSFKNTTFRIEIANISKHNETVYNNCCKIWAEAFRCFQYAYDIFYNDKKIRKMLWPCFWSAHQKFFHYLCLGIKVPVVINIAKQALKEGKCVVIGLQSTGESKTNEALEEHGAINDFLSTAKAVFESLVKNHFPCPSNRQEKRATSLLADSNESIASDSSESIIDLRNILDEDKNSKGIVTRNKRKQVLDELVKEKQEKEKISTRTLRAKRRSCIRTKGPSTKIGVADDSDTDISSVMSLIASDESTSSYSGSSDTSKSSKDSQGSTSDNTVISEKNQRVKPKVEKNVTPKKSPVDRKNIIESSDSDCEITGTYIKPKNYETIILSSGDECTNPSDQKDSNTLEPVDAMTRHAQTLTEMKNAMLTAIKTMENDLPNNLLDDLIDQLGGTDAVAEMTGRKGRIVKDEDGSISYQNRFATDAPFDVINIQEKDLFMSGKKNIAIISEAASSGISLQADRRVKNQRRRVHITIELPWSADRAIQQFGRTHRSNQVSAPEYIFVISELAGEKRFASIVAKRLESLGALTHGDRHSSTQTNDFHQFNIMGRYSHDALMQMLHFIEEGFSNYTMNVDYESIDSFIADARSALIDTGLAKGSSQAISLEFSNNSMNIPLFMNRLLGMPVRLQNAMFKLYTDTLGKIIRRKKFAGQYDSGIIELNSDSGFAESSDPTHYQLKTKSGIVKCTLWVVKIERGIPWSKANTLYKKAIARTDKRSGFYTSYNPITKVTLICLMIRDTNEGAPPDQFRVYRPNSGQDPSPVFYDTVISKFTPVSVEKAEQMWSNIYDKTATLCSHMALFNSCSRIKAGMKCDVGNRYRTYNILSGGVLTAWPYIEARLPSATNRLQIVRVKLSDYDKIIGPIIPQEFVEQVRKLLQDGAERGIF